MARKRSRAVLTVAAVALLGAALAFAFWPRPMMVDFGEVAVGAMLDTIDEEGRTRVHDTYVVSTPLEGRLRRVDVEPGDAVTGGVSVVATMMPTNPAALDVRGREQAMAAVAAAEAALRAARAERNKALADDELARAELDRARKLLDRDTSTRAELERATRDARAAAATLDAATAVIAQREAELANARARLISLNDPDAASTSPGAAPGEEFAIRAPISGRVLRVLQQSETTLAAGTPILEIGDIDDDLEVVVELLSTDAVKVAPGHRVIIADWGGPEALEGVVERVDPWGFTKYSALGVEEQRVNAVIRFADARKRPAGLGHGFRVEARIVVWEDDDALIVPSGALFRDGPDWAVFVANDGKAARRRVEIGRDNGVQAEVKAGLKPGDLVILYPSSGIIDGATVARRTIQ
jgi:HlyD family secretion protein